MLNLEFRLIESESRQRRIVFERSTGHNCDRLAVDHIVDHIVDLTVDLIVDHNASPIMM